MTSFPLLGRLVTVLVSFVGQFRYHFRIFLNVWDHLSNRFFIVLDHFMVKNVRRCHNGENGVTTVNTLVGRSSKVCQTFIGRS